eukprot:13037204-Ditylum_brightwellii.AAC.1
MTLQQFPAEEDYWKTGQIVEKAADKMWKIRDAFVAVKSTMHLFMSRCCGKALVDEARIPCKGSAPCICVLNLCAETTNDLAWGMTGETVLCIMREHKWIGVEDLQSYLHCHWAMDNWFTSKPLYDKMVPLGQYPYGTIKVK